MIEHKRVVELLRRELTNLEYNLENEHTDLLNEEHTADLKEYVEALRYALDNLGAEEEKPKPEMTIEECKTIIGNLPVYGDECYTIPQYQEAKAMAIDILDKYQTIQELTIYQPSESNMMSLHYMNKAEAYDWIASVVRPQKDTIWEMIYERNK